jgi:hypothetical protein
MASAGIEPHECVCIIRLDSDPPPIQSGCACRSDTGLAYVGCLVEKAVVQQPHRGNAVWWKCQTWGAATHPLFAIGARGLLGTGLPQDRRATDARAGIADARVARRALALRVGCSESQVPPSLRQVAASGSAPGRSGPAMPGRGPCRCAGGPAGGGAYVGQHLGSCAQTVKLDSEECQGHCQWQETELEGHSGCCDHTIGQVTAAAALPVAAGALIRAY